MKEEILKLRNEGKTYNEIQKILGCSKGTISYHCGEGQKEKAKRRRKKRRENKIIVNTERFKYNTKCKKYFQRSVWMFQKSKHNEKREYDKNILSDYTWKDVLDYYGVETTCYLTGDKINLYEDDYTFDHIIPISRGGDNSFENLGICNRLCNQMKTDLLKEELLEMCEKILKYNGYEVNEIK